MDGILGTRPIEVLTFAFQQKACGFCLDNATVEQLPQKKSSRLLMFYYARFIPVASQSPQHLSDIVWRSASKSFRKTMSAADRARFQKRFQQRQERRGSKKKDWASWTRKKEVNTGETGHKWTQAYVNI